MEEPVIAQKKSYALEMNPGTYWWCTCGRSQSQPFCDNSHKGTGFSPIETRIDSPQRVAWCGCKHTKTPPFCDGSHKTL